MIEQRAATPGYSEPVFLARERGTGVRAWLKHAVDPQASAARIAAEAALLPRLESAHVIRLAAAGPAADPPWLAYVWQAEAPLTPQSLLALPMIDRARLALDLLDTINYLHGLPEPMAHNRLELGALWVTPELSWLRLAQFGDAVRGAQPPELAAERSAAVRLMLQLAQPDGNVAQEVEQAAQAWIDNGEDALAGLHRALKLLTLVRLTADL